MALTDYEGLQSAIAYRCGNRSDAQFLASIVDAITLAEADMQRSLETTESETTVTLTTAAGVPTVALPADYSRIRRIRLLLSGTYTDIGIYALGVKQEWGCGQPMQAAVQGPNLVLTNTPDQAYQLVVDYWARFIPLATNATSNWILASYPDAYLYGGMSHALAGTGSLDRATAFASLFKQIIDDINLASFDREDADTRARTDLAWVNRRPFNMQTGR